MTEQNWPDSIITNDDGSLIWYLRRMSDNAVIGWWIGQSLLTEVSVYDADGMLLGNAPNGMVAKRMILDQHRDG